MNDAQQPINALPKGYRLQEYELVRVLGFGGFGMTYLGFDHNLDKAAAISVALCCCWGSSLMRKKGLWGVPDKRSKCWPRYNA